MKLTKRVLIPLAPGCEELEAVTLSDLLTRAGCEVIIAGLSPGLVECSRGLRIQPSHTLDEVMDEDFDLIVLPGGLPGADHLAQDPRIHQLIQHQVQLGKMAAAICAAPKALAAAGVLPGRSITAYPGVFAQSNDLEFTLTPSAIEDNGNILTSRGPGTAMDFALHLIQRLLGEEKRQSVEAGLVR